ncbi:galactosyltransferase-related protein [Escherichia coli]|uniref:galactosyltransferase-related protein n=1 Tax=Escherichia coli TaxID=562 RepID=UPI00227E90CF|nr:galactosyltransferase-related protein [Escherichia coli]MCZ0216550.1 galactosyltransferase-related protein [Escherichia coli]MCZ0314577.1 galactosyltransferase-related protein [Escherichia coli]MCZ0323549.1 galactosyltransferase-related protein [Escherichia coli]MCZ0377122.1 galactosyltransferase-related protein [Escherichia coli]MCZ0381664.1 galactosyltransferase-related protein [Escherichia coli]
MSLNISVITPFYVNHGENKRDSFALQRLTKCVHSFPNPMIANIFIATNQNYFKLPGKNPAVFHDIQNMEVYSPGISRNNIITHVSTQNIFIVDADLICSTTLHEQLQSQREICMQVGVNAFEMYPCLYLTKEETEQFDGDFQGCLESFLRGENHRVEGIALASSCLLLNREWFLQLGGFDERFVGHGGEDLELIDRLCQHYPIGPRPADYGLNIKAQHPGDYQGFRRYFSYYALPHLFAGRFLVHQWHPRPLTHPYHKRRAGNDALLEQMLANPGPLKGPVIPCNDLNGELPDFREWMIRLQEEAGYPVSEYPGLLRWKDGVTVKRPLWRKMRKLYLNPKAFFKDMVKSKS